MLARIGLLAALAFPAVAWAQTTLPNTTTTLASTARTASAASATPPDSAATARAEAVMTAHIRTLHDRLQITQAQEPQWGAFASAMMENARHVAALHEELPANAPSAPAELRHYAKVSQAHADDTARLIGPFDALYAAMTPEQHVIADRTFHAFQQERNRRAGE